METDTCQGCKEEEKPVRATFCGKCTWRLPVAHRKLLMAAQGEREQEHAFSEARKFLEGKHASR
jgi:hypothetical protein